MPSSPALSILALAAGLVAASVSAQAPRVEPNGTAKAILHWASAFQRGHLEPQGSVPLRAGTARKWVRLGVASGAFDLDDGRATAMTLLHQLLDAAERQPRGATAEALLALGSIGLDGDMFNPAIRAVRDLGHFALLRTDDPAVWHRVHEIARGVNLGLPAEPFFEPGTEVMWRVAAILALGVKEHAVFRSSIEKGLVDADPRIRLASAEALTAISHTRSLPAFTAAMATEEHPLAGLQMVTAVHRILDRHAERIAADTSAQALRAALARLGEVDWRTDMAIVRLVTAHPTRDAVQPMIAILRNARGQPDPILKIINENASLMLAAAAQTALEETTGARHGDDANLWQAFWNSEKDRIVVRRRSRETSGRTSARRVTHGFFGIPVLGSNVVFVLDTSGSMDEIVESKVPKKPTAGRTSAGVQTMRASRLRVACRQTLRAVQGMPERARFSIVTFSSTVRRWNSVPVPARASSRSTASGIFARLSARGGTNVYDALVEVLEAERVGYGQQNADGVDEIFVLTDGQPTSGRLTDPERILEAVRKVNAVRRARINTVFAGTGQGSEFLRRLAEENGGVFVQS